MGSLLAAPYFHLTDDGALRILGEVHSAVSRWRRVAKAAVVGMSATELEAFAPAFEHEETRSAKRRLA
jgi:serine/threonine-protein kinase HipA